MNLEQLSYLITNVTAITQQVFTIQCGEFATALAKDDGNELEVKEFDLVSHLSSFDFQSILDSGYKDKDEMIDTFSEIANRIDNGELLAVIGKLPSELAPLSSKITADELKSWIEHTLSADSQASIYQLHQLFSSGSSVNEEPIGDLIRQAIAFDDLNELASVTKVSSSDITLDDLGTAVMIQSFKVLEWMLQYASLSDDDVIELLVQQKDDSLLLKRLATYLRPHMGLLPVLKDKAKSLNLPEILEILRDVE